MSNLILNGLHDVGPLTETFVPSEFFCNGIHTIDQFTETAILKDFFHSGNLSVKLNIWEGFKKRVLSLSGEVSKKQVTTLTSYNLAKAMYSREVRAGLPENHVFAIDDLWIIADLISSQPGGEKGPLLNIGYANLFYFQVKDTVLLVLVNWNGSGWSVCSCDVDESYQWYSGHRVFS